MKNNDAVYNQRTEEAIVFASKLKLEEQLKVEYEAALKILKQRKDSLSNETKILKEKNPSKIKPGVENEIKKYKYNSIKLIVMFWIKNLHMFLIIIKRMDMMLFLKKKN